LKAVALQQPFCIPDKIIVADELVHENIKYKSIVNHTVYFLPYSVICRDYILFLKRKNFYDKIKKIQHFALVNCIMFRRQIEEVAN